MKHSSLLRGIIAITLLSLVVACASKRPVLYPNAHLQSVGRATAENDIDACIALANSHGADESKATEVAKDSATGAAIGGATGAVSGAVYGNPARGAAAGVAGGAVAGLSHGLIKSDEPDPVFQNFVNKCLRDKGYHPIGWR